MRCCLSGGWPKEMSHVRFSRPWRCDFCPHCCCSLVCSFDRPLLLPSSLNNAEENQKANINHCHKIIFYERLCSAGCFIIATNVNGTHSWCRNILSDGGRRREMPTWRVCCLIVDKLCQINYWFGFWCSQGGLLRRIFVIIFAVTCIISGDWIER